MSDPKPVDDCPCTACIELREDIPAVIRATVDFKADWRGALPNAPESRKAIPLCTGVLDYFPLALAAVAECSLAGNRQHHPDKPLHWDKSKSTDEADALLRHLAERGTLDTDGIRHSAKVAWRALALLQRELEEI